MTREGQFSVPSRYRHCRRGYRFPQSLERFRGIGSQQAVIGNEDEFVPIELKTSRKLRFSLESLGQREGCAQNARDSLTQVAGLGLLAKVLQSRFALVLISGDVRFVTDQHNAGTMVDMGILGNINE